MRGRLIAKKQICRHPKREATQSKSHRGLGQAIKDERPVAQQRHVILPGRALSFVPDAASRARVHLEETKQTENNSGNRDKIKRPAPAELSVDQSSEHVPKSASNRNRAAKNRHNAAALLHREVVGQDGRRGGTITAFANSHEDAREKEGHERYCETGGGGGEAPENHANADDDPAREAIGQEPENWRRQHVGKQKRRRE